MEQNDIYTGEGQRLNVLLMQMGVPESIANELLGLVMVVNGVAQHSYEYWPEWNVTVERHSHSGRVELYAELNRIEVNFTRGW